MSNTTRIRGVCAAAKRKVKRPTKATAAAMRFARQKALNCICSQDGAECQAFMCVVQLFARRCGLDARDERDYKIMMQLCDAYHEGYYAGYDAGYEYVTTLFKHTGATGES